MKTILNFCIMSLASHESCEASHMSLHMSLASQDAPPSILSAWALINRWNILSSKGPSKTASSRAQGVQAIPTGAKGPFLATSEILGRGTSFDSILNGSIHTW